MKLQLLYSTYYTYMTSPLCGEGDIEKYLSLIKYHFLSLPMVNIRICHVT